MTQILLCAHPWQLIQSKQVLWDPAGNKETSAIYRCPFCQRTKSEGDPDPRVILGRIEEEK